MHQVSIPPSVVDRIIARRGKPHCFDDLDPRRTALVVIDMQNAFMLPGVGHSPCATAPEIVPNINRIARMLRATGGTVVWVKTRFTPDSLTAWSTYYGMLTPAAAEKRIGALTPGGKGYELWPELEALPDDLVIDKERFSAFLPGSSDIARILRGRGIDSVIVTGTVTNVCCESTARDAMMMNFKTIMVTDGNAATTDAEHNASLTAFYLNFGDIMPTDMVVACLERNATDGRDPAAAAAQ
ncbi:MAG TPA: isochorismatase family cysteine hydrolase [Stellaceae bacterium]|nr:isochorismatase family cysteine hydrolase [Stellaceae bacterium]